MLGLGIETSCDETSIGIVEDGKKLIHLQLYSQIELHEKFRGVVPELASRAHLEKINFLLEQALKETNLSINNFSYVAVSARPGLLGSLMVGAQLARCISLTHGIPIVPVDHLEAHLSVVNLEGNSPAFPFLGLLLSGGNSAIFEVNSYGSMKAIANTKDDALGEAFDKVASLLNLEYPGGPAIEKRALSYSPKPGEKSLFPEILKDLPTGSLMFSYSGIKTSVYYSIKGKNLSEEDIQRISFHFQNTAFKLVEKNLVRAVKMTGINTVVAAGGVMANETLRKRLKEISHKYKFTLYFPEKRILCTDNGVMVACLGYYLFKQGKIEPLDFKISPTR